ncbi:Probable RNA polymerase sigma factor fecI [Streptococcus pneumoniae]|jgi:RNA polymerase sigma factor (sigma-70 family)|uniref:sigma-70 family RNA polymerase sigma factor n=1 Tax=Stutzerimonas stutzeri TaxID=316 RepID=UPI0005DADC4A|nr:sigma-70 family RNA polymerase sigma factor [Stutzerimonas stutzeri]MBW8335523.1 sigma-70 family RNA polymerase sigma factor [Pseudomonas sp.]CJL03865.1 Probable RNA polymerase sigma factor fecI [Streptococcus pneumoniae]MDH0058151.1 sigma-70 family RNA polymerase sigma factor [Stutzerimonas stutzeri]MDH0103061.1 sigma-70 family RNA polymerase sigma factor [Stutzerimonas stutzeri]MDH0156916.1 sigma-70 family RNA polymerase sigma factor [Stutzerimonas stutzeri]
MATEGMLRQQMLHRFYADHHGWLNGWLRRQLGCSQRAADLAQDTFVRVLSKDDDMAAIREPRAYLHTIAKGLLINHWRRRQIEQAYLDALALQPEPVVPSPESQALIVETLLRIDAMLTQLPTRVRSAFLMSQLHGMTYAAIATELGVSERMVKKYMAQAMLHCLMLVAED